MRRGGGKRGIGAVAYIRGLVGVEGNGDTPRRVKEPVAGEEGGKAAGVVHMGVGEEDGGEAEGAAAWVDIRRVVRVGLRGRGVLQGGGVAVQGGEKGGGVLRGTGVDEDPCVVEVREENAEWDALEGQVQDPERLCAGKPFKIHGNINYAPLEYNRR